MNARIELDDALEVYRAATQMARWSGDWSHARQAGEAVHQARAALEQVTA